MQLCFSSLFGNLLRLSVHKTCLLWSHFYSFFKINLFIFDCTVFIAVFGLSLVEASRGYSSLQRSDFTCYGAKTRLQDFQQLGHTGSAVSACRPQSLGSVIAQAQLLCGMQNIPRQGIEPMFRALAGVFLFTAPPGNSQFYFFFSSLYTFFFPLPYSAGYDLQYAVKYRQQQQTRCLVSILQGKTFSNLPLYMTFTRLRKCPSVPSLLRLFKS